MFITLFVLVISESNAESWKFDPDNIDRLQTVNTAENMFFYFFGKVRLKTYRSAGV